MDWPCMLVARTLNYLWITLHADRTRHPTYTMNVALTPGTEYSFDTSLHSEIAQPTHKGNPL